MTAPNGMTPEGAIGVSGLGEMQQMTEDDVRRRLRLPIDSAFASARADFLSSIKREVFAPLAKIFAGSDNGGLPEITNAVTDQQDKLMTLVDERGRGQVFSAENLTFRGGKMLIPFTEQVGPLVDVSISSEGGLILESPGSWEITAKVAVSGTGYWGGNWQRMWIDAYRKDGSLLAESWATTFAGTDQTSMIDVMQLVINEEEARDGVTIKVYQDAGRWRYFLGGHGYTMLKAQKLSSAQIMSYANPGYPGDMQNDED